MKGTKNKKQKSSDFHFQCLLVFKLNDSELKTQKMQIVHILLYLFNFWSIFNFDDTAIFVMIEKKLIGKSLIEPTFSW